jgi:carboxymethylenebutenolidase
MSKLVLGLLMIAIVAISGCAQMAESNEQVKAGQAAAEAEGQAAVEQDAVDQAALEQVTNESLNISSGNMDYPAYLAAPSAEGKWPAVVMIHSFNGLEPGYMAMADQLASQGFVVIAPLWQTFERSPRDTIVAQLVNDSVSYLKTRQDVQGDHLGLTGFCAGGRYTMLLLPLMNESFSSGVAWYGFPYRGPDNQSRPADLANQLADPMLIIHGTHDQPSNISEIYQYATELNATGKYFELKVYQGEPHGFMIDDGQLSQSFPAKDAFWQMASFFDRTLK